MTTIERLSVVVPADWIPGPEQGQWTYADYAEIPEDGQRYEIVNGVLLMTPAPNIVHQRIAGRFFRYLSTYVEDTGLGVVLAAPTDVELDAKVLVQPDVLVVLNAGLHKITTLRVVGAPDLVVEVTSPSTAAYDRLSKYGEYARAGVPEYWIVNPEKYTVEVLVLEVDKYHSLGTFQGKEIIPSQVITELPALIEQFFPRV